MTLPGDFRVGIARDYESCGCQGAEGCTRPVYGRVAGEVDSFGVEWIHLCKIHYLAEQAKPDQPVIDTCDWCRTADVEVFPTRDTDEGTHGPVYDVCKCCRQRQAKRDAEECGMYGDIEDYDEVEMEQFEDDEEEHLSDEQQRREAIKVLTGAVEAIDRFVESNSRTRVFIKKP
jgi:hypothetical protein